MKRLLYSLFAIILAIGVFIVSCSDDFLQKNPVGVLDESVLANADGIESVLVGAYAMLDGWSPGLAGNGWNSTTSNWVFADVYADDAYKGTDVGDQPQINPIERYEHTPANDYPWFKWSNMFDAISRTNDVMRITATALEEGTITDAFATQIRAEARFLRGFYHFEAIRIFDNIPYVDENAEDFLIPNTGTPWAEVEADLQFAVDHLPEEPRNGQVGRITKWAALGYLGKAKIYQGKYSEALPHFNEIINSGRFELTENFHDNFRADGDNNSESILQYQASINDGDNAGRNGNHGDILNFPYTGGPGACCGFHQPSQNLVNAYKTENGLPMLDDFNDADVSNDVGIGSEEPFTPYAGPLDPRLDWTVGRRGIPYLDWGPHPGRDWIRDQSYGGPYSPKKRVYYRAEEGVNSNAGGWGGGTSSNNYNLMRYADVLLMAAECEVEANNLEKAREYVNMIRERAANSQYFVKDANGNDAANYVISTYDQAWNDQATARKAVRFERRLELALEGHRFFDLKRWGIAAEVINEYLAEESTKRTYLQGAQFTPDYIRHPIPLNAIDLSQGTLTQNPGY